LGEFPSLDERLEQFEVLAKAVEEGTRNLEKANSR